MILLALIGCPLPDEEDKEDTGRGTEDSGPSIEPPDETTGTGAEYTGLHEYFPYDGSRQATYNGEDGSFLYVYNAEVTDHEGVDAVTWRYEKDGGYVASVVLASDEDGVRILGWTDGEEDIAYFESPVRITPESD